MTKKNKVTVGRLIKESRRDTESINDNKDEVIPLWGWLFIIFGVFSFLSLFIHESR